MSRYKRKILIIDKDFQMRFVKKFVFITLAGTLAALSIILVFYFFTYRHGGKNLVRYLIEVGLESKDINQRDLEGETPLHKASKMGNIEMIKFLVEQAGGSLNSRNNKDKKPQDLFMEDFNGSELHWSVIVHDIDQILSLLKEGVSPAQKDKLLRTPLHYAASLGHSEAALFLIKAGAQVNGQDKEGRTALHLASLSGNTALVQLLLDEKADKTIKDAKGYVAEEYSKDTKTYQLFQPSK